MIEDNEMINTIIYDLERHGSKEDSSYSAETAGMIIKQSHTRKTFKYDY